MSRVFASDSRMVVALSAKSELGNVDALLSALETDDTDVEREGDESRECARVAKRGGEIFGRRLNMFEGIVMVMLDGWDVLDVVVAECYVVKTFWLTAGLLLGFTYC